MNHYIAISGQHGCLANYCNVCNSYDNAVLDLAIMFELGDARRERLRNDRTLELGRNEYCEIEPCNCKEPWIHQDELTDEQWLKEYGESFGMVAPD